jgi:hypothetical protein
MTNTPAVDVSAHIQQEPSPGGAGHARPDSGRRGRRGEAGGRRLPGEKFGRPATQVVAPHGGRTDPHTHPAIAPGQCRRSE